MSEIVFILGAGASKEAGAPLMREFLDAADDLRKELNVNDEIKASFDLVFEGLRSLRIVQSNAKIDLQNIESVFAAFEMAELLGQLSNLNPKEIIKLPNAMKIVIEKTLEKSITFPKDKEIITPPVPYDKFIRLVLNITGKPPRNYRKVSIITFNYDLCLDYALHWAQIPINYCLRNDEEDNRLKVMKLHGSIN